MGGDYAKLSHVSSGRLLLLLITTSHLNVWECFQASMQSAPWCSMPAGCTAIAAEWRVSAKPQCRTCTARALWAQGPGIDPFGRFFDVMLRDMLGTIPGGEEFFTGLLGMAGFGDAAASPPFLSGGVRVTWSARKQKHAAYEMQRTQSWPHRPACNVL